MTNPAAPLTIGIISLGCAKNLVDSQVMAGVLLAEKLKLAPSPEEADIILVNTCAFVEDARTEAAETILRVCQHKLDGGCRAVIVAGCLPQRYRDRIVKTFPDVDAFLGVDELDRIGEIVRQVLAGERSILAVGASAPTRLFRPPNPGLRFSGGPFAYLKVAEGCNHVCAFCAIPGIRGRYRSRTIEELVGEAQALLQSGVRELNLISQDTTSYGCDLKASNIRHLAEAQRRRGELVSLEKTNHASRRDSAPQRETNSPELLRAAAPLREELPASSLPALLRALDALDGDFWIRLLYGYPSLVTDELLATMAASRHIVPYLDLPIQHSHPDMLRAMQRADTVRAVADLPQRLRQAIPGMVLRTTCIVGFPGETEEHFQQLLEYVKAAKFDHLGVFAFSPEEGTAAWDLGEEPDADVAAERCERLMQAQRQVVDARRQELVGSLADALLIQKNEERRITNAESGSLWTARLARQAPEVDGLTLVRGVADDAKPGGVVRVRITGGDEYDLEAVTV